MLTYADVCQSACPLKSGLTRSLLQLITGLTTALVPEDAQQLQFAQPPRLHLSRTQQQRRPGIVLHFDQYIGVKPKALSSAEMPRNRAACYNRYIGSSLRPHTLVA